MRFSLKAGPTKKPVLNYRILGMGDFAARVNPFEASTFFEADFAISEGQKGRSWENLKI
jgi:hypothetical protein